MREHKESVKLNTTRDADAALRQGDPIILSVVGRVRRGSVPTRCVLPSAFFSEAIC
jgi:hypothetical protein